MKRTLTAVGASLVAFTAAPAAMAQAKGEFGQQGQFIIGADRLLSFLGYSHYSYDLPTGFNQTKNNVSFSEWSMSFFYGSNPTTSNVAVFGGPGGGAGATLGAYGTNLAFTVPRVGLDYVVVPNVTVGGDVILYFTLGGNTSTEQDSQGGTVTTTSDGNPGITLFGIAPRGGYILGLNDMFSLWLRGGFSFYTWTAKQTINNGNTTLTAGQNQFALDLEPQIVLTAIPHVGFTAGVTMDIPLVGQWSDSTENNGTTRSDSGGASILYLGLTMGMLAYF